MLLVHILVKIKLVFKHARSLAIIATILSLKCVRFCATQIPVHQDLVQPLFQFGEFPCLIYDVHLVIYE